MSNIMRLTGITLPGTGYPALSSFLDVTPFLPVASGLTGLYYLRESGGRETQNFVSGGAPLTRVGAPTMQATGAICDVSNYYNTGLLAQPGGTFIAIAKPSSAPTTFPSSIPIVSGYSTSAGNGSGDALWCGTNLSGAGQVIGAAASTPGDGVTPQGSPAAYQTIALPAVSPIAMFGTFTGTPNRHAVGYLPSAGASLVKTGYPTGAPTFARPTAPFGPALRIGASPLGFTGQSNVSLVAIFNRVLTDAEILQNLEYLRGDWGVKRGIWS